MTNDTTTTTAATTGLLRLVSRDITLSRFLLANLDARRISTTDAAPRRLTRRQLRNRRRHVIGGRVDL